MAKTPAEIRAYKAEWARNKRGTPKVREALAAARRRARAEDKELWRAKARAWRAANAYLRAAYR